MEYENTGNAGTDDREYSVMPVYEEAFQPLQESLCMILWTICMDYDRCTTTVLLYAQIEH